MTRERNEDGMVYRGACDLIHIEDGKRIAAGESVARYVDRNMREAAVLSGARSNADAYGIPGSEVQPLDLCPGCYMVALFNAAVALANDNGQSLGELGESMGAAFRELARGGPACIESINVVLDAAGDSCPVTVAGFDGQRVQS